MVKDKTRTFTVVCFNCNHSFNKTLTGTKRIGKPINFGYKRVKDGGSVSVIGGGKFTTITCPACGVSGDHEVNFDGFGAVPDA